MMRKYKKTLLLTSLLTLLPIAVGLILWDKFPEKMTTHWGLDGQANGWSSVSFAVFTPPLLMLAVQWLCFWFCAKDPGNQGRNKKPLTLVLWIIPVISNLCCYLMYALTLGWEPPVEMLMAVPLGLLFSVIGNYLPKCKMNSTVGIKVPWAYTSEENWNATHRFGGRVWVIGGVVMALSALLPAAVGGTLFVIAIFALILIPTIYSYLYYRRQKQRGDAITPIPKLVSGASKGSLIAVILLLVFVGSILFTGDLEFTFGETGLTVVADYYNDYQISYEDIQSAEYREGNISGTRVGGYGSFQLLMGYFKSDEFGVYTRYTYYKPEACVVLTANSKPLVLSGENAEETQSLFLELLKRCGEETKISYSPQ